MKRTHALWTMGLAGALLAGCQQNRVASTRYAAASYPPPMHSRLRIKTEPLPETQTAPLAQAPAATAPAAPAPGAVDPGTQAPADGAVSHGFVTETPGSVPHGTTPVNTRPTETPQALPANLPAPKLPSKGPSPAPGAAPTLPPPPLPSSRTTPGKSKGHADPNGGETIIIMSQSDSSADKSLMLVNNRTAPAPASPVVNAAHTTAPKEGVCTITGEAQQFRRTWRLRYAPLDSEDTHGGSVMLVGEGLGRIREGQQIRVVGTMQPAEERTDVPRFQVQFLEILSR